MFFLLLSLRHNFSLDLQVGSYKSTKVDLGLAIRVKSVFVGAFDDILRMT